MWTDDSRAYQVCESLHGVDEGLQMAEDADIQVLVESQEGTERKTCIGDMPCCPRRHERTLLLTRQTLSAKGRLSRQNTVS